MTDYAYINEYEKEQTQKYEGCFTPENVALNNRLLEECLQKDPAFDVIEELLKQGADPLGGTASFGWGTMDHIYEEIILNGQSDNSEHLPRITELFLQYGMNVDAPRVPYDGDNSLNPLWSLAFCMNDKAISTLKILLDHGLSAEGFAECWDHAVSDLINVECGDPEGDWNNACVCSLKMTLLGAAYDHILKEDDGLREFLCCDHNEADIHMFREWNDFEYRFDVSHCERHPELYGSIVHIFSRKSGKEVWTIGIGSLGREFLFPQ